MNFGVLSVVIVGGAFQDVVAKKSVAFFTGSRWRGSRKRREEETKERKEISAESAESAGDLFSRRSR